MDCSLEFFCHDLISGSLLRHVWLQDWVFFLFLFVHQVQFKLKTSSAPETHLYYTGWRFACVPCSLFATHSCQHACTDTPQDAAEWRRKSCTILSEKVLFLPIHALCSPCVHKDTEIVSWWWHLHLIMLQSSLICEFNARKGSAKYVPRKINLSESYLIFLMKHLHALHLDSLVSVFSQSSALSS